MEILYTAAIEVSGGRQGRAEMVNGAGAFDLAFPIALGGTGGGTNPEQLLGVAFGASLGSNLDLEARQHQLTLREISIASFVSLGHSDDGGYALAVELHVRLPEIDRKTAERLVQAAERQCPYCRMASGNIELRLVLVPAESS